MSKLICKGCNRVTISSMSQGASELEATACFVAMEEGKIVKGCGYDKGDALSKELADKYLEFCKDSTFKALK